MKQIEVQIMGQSYLLGCPDGGQVAIALIRDDDLFRACAFDSCGSRGRASMGNLHIAGVEIIVGKY